MIVNVEDLRRLAQRRLPRAVFDFIEGGAEDEWTLGRNRAAFDRLSFRPRVLVDVSRRDQSTTLFGQSLSSPLMLAPTGLCGMAAPRGELLAARGAVAQGVPFTLSCMSAVSIEDVAREAPGPHWFQMYIWRDRALTRSLVERAHAAGYRGLMITVDAPIPSQRERDLRNGATIPPRITWRNALDSARKLGWLTSMARNPRIDFANIADYGFTTGRGPLSLGPFAQSQFDPSTDWEDLAWFRSIWPGPLGLKGVMSAEDARRAVDEGVELIIVSNHGGRQLDGLPSALEVLPEVVDAVKGRAEVVLDGGVRRGSDVIKALSLGARACMIGRPYLYGLAAGGQAGVERALTILRLEIDRAQALLGRATLADLDRSVVRGPAAWQPD